MDVTGKPFEPMIPAPADIALSENSRQVLQKRYLRNGPDGKPIETIPGMFRRVARAVAEPDGAYGDDIASAEDAFYGLLTSRRFFPNSPTFTGAGTPLGQLAACQPYHARVVTDRGLIPIGELVETQSTAHVVAFIPPEADEPVSAYRVSAAAGQSLTFGDIVATASNGIKPVLRLTVLGGLHLDVTPDHRVWASPPAKHGRFAWYEAGELAPGWLLIVDSRPKPFATTPLEGFDEATAAIVGWLQADGYVGQPATATSPIIEFETINEDEYEWIQRQIRGSPLANAHQHVREHVVQDETLQYRRIRIYGQEPYAQLANYGLTNRKNLACIPDQVYRSPKSVVASYLRALFQCDGSVEASGFISLASVSHILLEGVQQLLLQFGITSSIITYNGHRGNRMSNHKLHIGLHSSRCIFEEEIGFVSHEKRAKLAQLNAQPGKQQSALRAVMIDSVESLGEMPVYDIQTTCGTYLSTHIAIHNCFVLPISDDLGKNSDGIFQTLRDAALIQQTGGGNGFSFSRLRPKGDSVASSAGVATGPVGFLRTYDGAFGEVAQGGTRRGANMAVLRVDHPDIEAFVTCKAKEGDIANFNISVGITDAFMQAVEADADFPLVNPRDDQTWRTVRARELFDKIVTFAHHNGEPGALFLDGANRGNPVPHLYALEATNPCFVGNTRVATDQGFLTMAELHALGTPLMVATDMRAAPEWVRSGTIHAASPVRLTRRDAPVLTLRTQHGYTVTATPDHRFLTIDRGYVPLNELKPGDRLLIQADEGPWSQKFDLPNLGHVHEKMAVLAHGGDHASGRTITRRDFSELYAATPTLWSYDLGLTLGWLVGDGWLSPTSNSPVGFTFGMEAGDYCGADTLRPILTQWFGPGHLHERGNIRQLTYGRLPYEFFASLGVSIAHATEKRVPTSIWQAPRDAVRGFLAGLFSADGSVQVNEAKQDCTVRLASSSAGLLQDVQMLLANFGIVSRIYLRRNHTVRSMPDGKGGRKDYASAPQFELVLGKSNRVKFAEIIGFAHRLKQARLLQHVAGSVRGAYRERYEDRVLTIEDAGTADVYDLAEPATNSFIANGMVVHNCGEQWLGPYENCCLGSINLAEHVTADDRVDWEKLRESTVVATRFLDNVVDANKYVPAVPQLKEAALRARRIGLGIMGLGDLMYRLGVRYGSAEGQEFAAQVMEFIRYHCMATSVALAGERGPFGAIKGSIYDPTDLRWQPPAPLTPYTHDWGRPALAWDAIVAGIKRHGIRNAAQTTVAPTGTIGTVAGCEGYGCEPVFALAYTRTVKDGDRDLKLTYTSPLFARALMQAGLDKAARDRISEMVSVTGSCQDMPEAPAAIRHTFVVAQDITAEEHVRMQAAIQAFVDNSISKTINFPSTATVEDVKQAYLLAWKLGCKGLTVYVTGSRQEVVLETKATTGQKAKDAGEAASEAASTAPKPPAVQAPASPFQAQRRPRPSALPGTTYRKETPLGTAYITVNVNGHDQPFEVFLNVGKAGSDVAAVSEALGRLISLGLRLPSPLDPVERMKLVIDQLAGIGGGRSMGFGANRVRSLPDAVAQVLREHLNGHFNDEEAEESDAESYVEQLPLPITDRPIGDLCPDCGQATFVPTEGCRKCYACGYSEC